MVRCSGIKHHIKKISGEEVILDTDFGKTKFLSDDSLPLGKLIYFPNLTVFIKCAFKQNRVFDHKFILMMFCTKYKK